MTVGADEQFDQFEHVIDQSVAMAEKQCIALEAAPLSNFAVVSGLAALV